MLQPTKPAKTPSYRLVLTRTISAAAEGLREYATSEECEAPLYWRLIADDLERQVGGD